MPNPTKQQLLEALARERLFPLLSLVFADLHPGKPPLKPHWYLLAMCWLLEKVEKGLLLRAMIWIQPRALKSITVAVAYPCWLMGRNPAVKIMVVTYAGQLSRQHAEHRRSIMQSAWYQRIYPMMKIAKPGNRQSDIVTTMHGSCLSLSVEGAITGMGADFIILDDCMNAEDVHSQVEREKRKRWFDNTLSSRASPDEKKGAIISIQQRLHEDDLPAYLLEKGFECLSLPAIGQKDVEVEIGPGRLKHFRSGEYLCPERFNEADAERKRREMGPHAFSAQYLQDPVAPEGNLFQGHWFQRYSRAWRREDYRKVVQSWDTAMSSSPTANFSVGITFGFRNHKWHLIDVFRQRLDYPDLKRAVIRLWRHYEADEVLIEDAASGKSLWQDLRVSGPFRPIMWPANINKEEQFVGTFGEVEGGHILLPEEAPWLDTFCKELRAFPAGQYDDQVDAFSQFVEWQKAHWKWAMSRYDENGRRMRIVRTNRRPW